MKLTRAGLQFYQFDRPGWGFQAQHRQAFSKIFLKNVPLIQLHFLLPLSCLVHTPQFYRNLLACDFREVSSTGSLSPCPRGSYRITLKPARLRYSACGSIFSEFPPQPCVKIIGGALDFFEVFCTGINQPSKVKPSLTTEKSSNGNWWSPGVFLFLTNQPA